MPAGGRQRRMLREARRSRRVPARGGRAAMGNLVKRLRVSVPASWWTGLGWRGRMLLASATALVVAAVCLVAVLLAVSGPAPRARQYLAFTACLLTDSNGLAGASAAPAWAGMEDASLATHAKVEYQPVMSGSTEAAAQPVLASLVVQQCRVIVAAGPAPVAAVIADARQYRSVRFAVVSSGTATKAGGPNVTVVAGSVSAVRSAIDGFVRNAVAAS